MVHLLREPVRSTQLLEKRITFEPLINIRPRMGNRNILIQDDAICRQAEAITREF